MIIKSCFFFYDCKVNLKIDEPDLDSYDFFKEAELKKMVENVLVLKEVHNTQLLKDCMDVK